MRLKKIDLRKGKEHNHPDIEIGPWYLAQMQGCNNRSFFVVGTFSRQRYGLHFDCDWGCSGLQYDTPGTNMSDWEKLWKLLDIR